MKKLLMLILALAMMLSVTAPALAFTSMDKAPLKEGEFELSIRPVKYDAANFARGSYFSSLPEADEGYLKNEMVAAVISLNIPKWYGEEDGLYDIILSIEAENIELFRLVASDEDAERALSYSDTDDWDPRYVDSNGDGVISDNRVGDGDNFFDDGIIELNSTIAKELAQEVPFDESEWTLPPGTADAVADEMHNYLIMGRLLAAQGSITVTMNDMSAYIDLEDEHYDLIDALPGEIERGSAYPAFGNLDLGVWRSAETGHYNIIVTDKNDPLYLARMLITVGRDNYCENMYIYLDGGMPWWGELTTEQSNALSGVPGGANVLTSDLLYEVSHLDKNGRPEFVLNQVGEFAPDAQNAPVDSLDADVSDLYFPLYEVLEEVYFFISEAYGLSVESSGYLYDSFFIEAFTLTDTAYFDPYIDSLSFLTIAVEPPKGR